MTTGLARLRTYLGPSFSTWHAAARRSRGATVRAFLVSLGLLSQPAGAADPVAPAPSAHEAVIAGDYFGAGSHLAPGQAVEGDAFVAGGQVALQAAVNGDAVLSGATVTVSAPVGDDLYATGGSVLLASAVNGNARFAGADVEVSRAGSVAGKATIAARHALVTGRVGRQLVIFADTARIDGHVAGNASVVARRLELGPDARIDGKLTYRGPHEAVVEAGAIVAGGTNHIDFDIGGGFSPFSTAAAWIVAIACTFGLFLLGWASIVAAPLVTARVSMLARARQFASLGIGLLVILLLPLVAAVLAMTVIGIPIAIVMFLAWPMLLVFGYLTGVMSVTDAICGATPRRLPGSGLRVFVLFLGLVGMLAFCAVPIIGWVLGMLLTVAGTGSLALYAFGGRADASRPRQEEEEILFRREPTFRF
jgi:cytoskeletal protein CcmA (bactofilin family)